MPKIIICIFITLLVSSCSRWWKTDEESKARKMQGYVQTADEAAARMKYNCPATTAKFCKNQDSRCVPVYTSDHTKKECKEVDDQKIKRMCDKVDVVFYDTEKECLNIKEADNCPQDLTKDFDVKNLYKCPALYKKICSVICGKRYDATDIRAAWQIPKGDYAVICLDNSKQDMKNGVSYSSDRKNHSCYTDAETHVAAGGARTWCIKYNDVYNGYNLGAYLQCASRL